jgi:hypothetical protein
MVLTLPDAVRDQVARWAHASGREAWQRTRSSPAPVASMEKASEAEGFPPPPGRVRRPVFAR